MWLTEDEDSARGRVEWHHQARQVITKAAIYFVLTNNDISISWK